MHLPVLLNETIELLNLEKGYFIVDGTVDGGGHAEKIIEKIMPGGEFLGIDLDKDTIAKTEKEKRQEFKKFASHLHFEHGNYKDIVEILKNLKLSKADGVMVDLGYSSWQIDDQERGFSFKGDGRLDMRYDVSSGFSAEDVINGTNEEELANILYQYGEERFSRRIAKGIIETRKKHRIENVGELVRVISHSVPAFYQRGKISCATKSFQALRIYVNKEFENLTTFLADVKKVIRPGGRLVVITFHSLEDRIVKRSFQQMHKDKIGIIINKKVIRPTEEEIQINPRSRSAKIRAIKII